jgi:hypothetical protein
VLQDLYAAGPESENFKDYCALLYDQALLIEGITPEDPVSFANNVARLMARGGNNKNASSSVEELALFNVSEGLSVLKQ